MKHELDIFAGNDPFGNISLMQIRLHKAIMPDVVFQESGWLYDVEFHNNKPAVKLATYLLIDMIIL
jgi:hypothetical protein